jgi:hypothetical protein
MVGAGLRGPTIAFAPPIACGHSLDESALRLHPKPLAAHAAVCTESARQANHSRAAGVVILGVELRDSPAR